MARSNTATPACRPPSQRVLTLGAKPGTLPKAMQRGSRRGAAAGIRTAGIALLCGLAAVSPLIGEGAGACAPAGSVLRLGFYAHFEPVSYSADPDPASPGFDDHRGYEADLLTALEAMEGANLARGAGDLPVASPAVARAGVRMQAGACR